MEEVFREKIENAKEKVVLYHAHCVDGFTAAWAAWLSFGDTATYVPVKRGSILPEGLEGREVYVVDFSYSQEDITWAESITRRFVIIDHHISSKDEVTFAKEHVFELDYSGAYLAWKFFHPEEEVPFFVRYVSDGDINKRTLPDHNLLTSVIYARRQDFAVWNEMRDHFETQEGREKILRDAVLISEYKEKFLSGAKESVHFVKFEGVVMPAINALLPIDERSEVLQHVYTLYPPVALMYRYDDGQWKCSLRSDGSFDCTTIAVKYGGGGHKGAAGFAIPGTCPLPFTSDVLPEEIPRPKDPEVSL